MSQHYTIISADCHAGGSHEMYREYVDAAYLEDFDAWRAKYHNPFRDLQGGGRVRNWDDHRRIGDLFDLEALAPLAERVGPTVGELARPLDRLPDRPNEALLKAAGISGR